MIRAAGRSERHDAALAVHVAQLLLLTCDTCVCKGAIVRFNPCCCSIDLCKGHCGPKEVHFSIFGLRCRSARRSRSPGHEKGNHVGLGRNSGARPAKRPVAHGFWVRAFCSVFARVPGTASAHLSLSRAEISEIDGVDVLALREALKTNTMLKELRCDSQSMSQSSRQCFHIQPT